MKKIYKTLWFKFFKLYIFGLFSKILVILANKMSEFYVKETEDEVKYWNKFNIERWYKKLEKETFYTEFIDITQEQAKVSYLP